MIKRYDVNNKKTGLQSQTICKSFPNPDMPTFALVNNVPHLPECISTTLRQQVRLNGSMPTMHHCLEKGRPAHNS